VKDNGATAAAAAALLQFVSRKILSHFSRQIKTSYFLHDSMHEKLHLGCCRRCFISSCEEKLQKSQMTRE
jgi:hypothetical protein